MRAVIREGKVGTLQAKIGARMKERDFQLGPTRDEPDRKAITGVVLTSFLERLSRQPMPPCTQIMDNGPEFTRKHLSIRVRPIDHAKA